MKTKNMKKMFKSTDHDKAHFHSYAFMFFTTISTLKKVCFFQSASWKWHCATHWRKQRGMDSSNFWLVRSEHAHASYPGLSFASPGSAPIGGGKKGESRDWTRSTLDVNWMQCVLKTMNNHWTMSKILWLVSGKQINYLPKLKAEANIVICETCPRLLLFSKGDNWNIYWIK